MKKIQLAGLLLSIFVFTFGNPAFSTDSNAVKQAQADVDANQARVDQAQTEIEKQNISLSYLQDHLDRLEPLAQGGAVTEEEYLSVKQQVDEARLDAKELQQKLSEMKADLHLSQAKLEAAQAH